MGFLSGSLAMIAGIYYLKKTSFIEETIENVITDLGRDEQMQKDLYVIGGILGQGIKGGIGLANTGGRMNLKSLGVSFAAQFLEKILAGQTPSQAAPIAAIQTAKDNFFK